ncbi:MAG: DapH/DapD/GlmU-related protein [Mariniblastus sp.]|nr:DapH/DapD/GlmU-related protein [Mariniblastus sp.]
MLQGSILLLERVTNGFRRRLNYFYFKATLKNVGTQTYFDSGVRIYGKQFVHIGSEVNVNSGVTIQSCGAAPVTIGDRVVLSYDCMILTGGLDRGHCFESREHLVKPVIIEDGVWLGARSVVLPGITIGKNSLIAAGSVVTKDVSDHTLVAGVPAKPIKIFK